jgi:hypothetical protein
MFGNVIQEVSMNSDATHRIDDIATDETAVFTPTTMTLQQTVADADRAAADVEDDQLEVGAEPESEDESDNDGEEEGEDETQSD